MTGHLDECEGPCDQCNTLVAEMSASIADVQQRLIALDALAAVAQS